MALKEEITAAAPVRRLEKGNVNTTLIRKNRLTAIVGSTASQMKVTASFNAQKTLCPAVQFLELFVTVSQPSTL